MFYLKYIMNKTQTRNFGLDSTTLLQSLEEGWEQLNTDPLNKQIARQCAINAWHMCDQLQVQTDKKQQFRNLRELQDHVKTVCPELAYMQDICIESKHAQITRHPPSILSAELYKGDFCPLDFDRKDWNVSRLKITTSDNNEVDFLDALGCVIQFWRTYTLTL